jgi:hypothetical protein
MHDIRTSLSTGPLAASFCPTPFGDQLVSVECVSSCSIRWAGARPDLSRRTASSARRIPGGQLSLRHLTPAPSLSPSQYCRRLTEYTRLPAPPSLSAIALSPYHCSAHGTSPGSAEEDCISTQCLTSSRAWTKDRPHRPLPALDRVPDREGSRSLATGAVDPRRRPSISNRPKRRLGGIVCGRA